MFTIGSFALIFNSKGEILLAHRMDKDLWNLPGGKVEKGESPDQAVIREVKEEVGLKVDIKRFVGVYSKVDKDEIVFSFECSIAEGKPTSLDETDRVEYFGLDSLPNNIVQRQIERIHDAIEKNEPVYKIQETIKKSRY